MPSEDFLSKWLPLILAGGSAAGSLIGGKLQAGASDRAAELQYKSGQEQLNALLAMYGTQRNDLASYRAAGTNALANIQNWKPNDPNRKMTSVDFSKFKPDQVSLPPALSRLTTGGTTGGNALSSGGTPDFGDISTGGIHSRLGGAVGGALGLGAGAAGVYGVASKLTPIARYVGGPVTMGLAAAGGAIAGGVFDNNNSDKNFASTGINRVSDWTWNTLMPAVRSGQKTPDDAEKEFNDVWARWSASMSNTPGFNKGVASSSVASQRQYFQPFFDELNKLRQPSGVA